MAPGLLPRPEYAGDECDNAKSEFVKRNLIRTDFVVQNVFSYLIKDEYKFDCLPAANNKEEMIMKELEEIVDEFKLTYSSTLTSLCSEMEVSEDTMGSVLFGIANELFCDGITWSKIVSLFVFVSELTLQCLYKSLPENIVNVIYECFRIFVKEKLKLWVDDHDGWEGLRSLSKSTAYANEELNDQVETSNVSWAKSFFRNALRMIGNIAHLANSKGETCIN